MPALYRYVRLVDTSTDAIKPFNYRTPPPCYFRTGHLNGRTPQRTEPRHGHPVPTATIQGRPCYVFDHMAFPVDDHLPSLLATAHHPDDTYTYKLVDRNGRTPKPPAPIKISADLTVEIARLVYLDMKSDNPHMLPRDGVKLVSSIIGADSLLLANLLIKMGESKTEDFLLPRKGGKKSFSTAAEYFKMYEEVKTASVSVRNASYKQTGSTGHFSINDLADEDCPGGYPTHCPVTGYGLEWLMPRGTSHFSPRIGRKDTRAGYVSGNVVLMASIAKRLLDGSTQPVHHANFLAHYPDIMPGVARWIQTHNT